MNIPLIQIVGSLGAGIFIIILLTARFGIPAFFALLIACFIVGLGIQMPMTEIISVSKQGFGNILQSLGLIIVLGTTLGVVLEQSGATLVMASFILKQTGEARSPAAMSITGFVTGLPIFCDSGYIVLSGINHSLARRTGVPMAFMAVSLATGLYAVHCLVPPHPGASAAATTIGVDFGKLMFFGILTALPAAFCGYKWAAFAGGAKDNQNIRLPSTVTSPEKPMPVIAAFLPVVIPILLIAAKSILSLTTTQPPILISIFSLTGDPVIALSIGILLGLTSIKARKKELLAKFLQEAIEKSGSILVIIGAGGAFGAILAASHLGNHLSNALPLQKMGILFPFLVTFILKTAQGSSTVAIITASSIVAPLLPALSLHSEADKLLTVLAMGAGSMMISHANDAYFWVIAKFSGLEMKTMLRVYSIATMIMGLVSFCLLYIVSLFIR